ncbi:hypothetical protein DOTSEDRAFT_70880 [Dothistroma septosporum NZE10]|uniref:Uncharacterized protein n=1 Tax=Dothistroma septosporum (strain NZE10 / CBS 128990) TaxID=675120 RepID=N1PPW7_DOTSN|nr:hypothetical protein DOTSEDRAFT_70880 [Dothistroma septosporum NZE10]
MSSGARRTEWRSVSPTPSGSKTQRRLRRLGIPNCTHNGGRCKPSCRVVEMFNEQSKTYSSTARAKLLSSRRYSSRRTEPTRPSVLWNGAVDEFGR